jgi:ParB family chromosome partitioning protein
MSQMENVFIENITVPAHRARGLDAAAVDRLADSITRLGLQTPITVRYDSDADDILLVAGLHRLEAARKLGWDKIPAIYTDGTADEARMWEIAENLHRAELSAIERAEHIEEWRRLAAKVSHVGTPLGGTQPTEAGIRKAAKELGVSKSTVERAAKIAALPPEVKQQAHAEGWSQTRALAAAASPSKPAPAIKNAFESEEDWRRALFTVWNRGAQDWRERALETIDRPVFDTP